MSSTYTDGECFECGVSAYMCDRCGHVVCRGCQEEADGCPVCQIDGEDCVLCIVELDEGE